MRLLYLLALIVVLTAVGCEDDDKNNGSGGPALPPPPPVEMTDVNVNLAEMPYDKLADYRFFTGERMADLQPNERVLDYKPISGLFSDYAHKSRFVWMPEGTTATQGSDGNIVDFPEGTVMIKTFFYDNVQPTGETRLIETRLIYKQDGGWRFADYIWNAAQTEASFSLDGGSTLVEFIDEDGELKSINYEIPSEAQCLTCHKIGDNASPIGPKPQNLNSTLTYSDGSSGNQLQKWFEAGYLAAQPDPESVETVVAWDNPTFSLDLRARSYLDMNCAHCHREGGHCDYRPIRLAFQETSIDANLGICVIPNEYIDDSQLFIVNPGNEAKSALFYRLNTTEENLRMPLLGRTIQHTEGLALIENWINSLTQECN
jgi:uncharacterized repeat protein (TIGR03806 family)